jgi:hypothetical protein
MRGGVPPHFADSIMERGAPYSAIEHVARIVSLQCWQEVLMVMLTCAFDVSQDQPLRKFLVMAGFVSDAKAWAEFDRLWRKRLADQGFSYFHMQKFAQRSEPFDKLDESQRRRLLSDLLDIIAGHTYQKFACVVQSQAFAKLSDDTRRDFAPTVIAAAGRFVGGLVFSWRDSEKYRATPEFVFEQGDQDRGSLIKVVREFTGRDPIFRPKKDDPVKNVLAFTPLHAADILAYEVKKIADNIDHLLPEDFQFRFPYQQLNKIPGEPRVLSFDRITEVDMLVRINEYFAKFPLGGETVQ